MPRRPGPGRTASATSGGINGPHWPWLQKGRPYGYTNGLAADIARSVNCLMDAGVAQG